MHNRRNYFQIRKQRASERGRKMAKARWKLDREKRDLEEPERIRELQEIEAINLPKRRGDALGCLQWHNFRTGKVRRWTIRIGDRIDRVTAEAPNGKITKSHGWTWIMDHLRGYLCGSKF